MSCEDDFPPTEIYDRDAWQMESDFTEEEIFALLDEGIYPHDYASYDEFYVAACDYLNGFLNQQGYSFTTEELDMLADAGFPNEGFSSADEWAQAARDFLDDVDVSEDCPEYDY